MYCGSSVVVSEEGVCFCRFWSRPAWCVYKNVNASLTALLERELALVGVPVCLQPKFMALRAGTENFPALSAQSFSVVE